MIEVVYDQDQNWLTVKGHAHSDEYGRDLICTAVSILVLTLRENVIAMTASGMVTTPILCIEDGYAEISCVPREEFQALVCHTFMALCVGFEVLATEYPDYISYSVVGWQCDT